MKPILSLIVAILAVKGFAQKETFDHLTFNPPAGWSKEKGESGMVFAQEDAKSGGFCKLIVTKAVPGTGKAKTDFDAAWNALVKDSLKIQSAPEIQPVQKKNGWDILSGGGSFEIEKMKVAVILVTASGASEMQSILVLTNTSQYQTNIETFLASVDVKKAAVEAKPVSNDKARTPQLWMKSAVSGGFEFGIGVNVKYRHKWFALYSNGDFYPYFPEEGFLGFDRESNSESWGTATIKGKKMTLEAKLWGRLNLDKISETQWNEEGSTIQKYLPCKSVDGLKLDGTYCPDGQDWPKKKATVLPGVVTYITFKKDGSFIDYGCYNDSTVAKPAKGNYVIKNFTIVLQYDNGFVKKRGFCGLGGADPFKEDVAYFIGQFPWFKGKI